MITIRISINDSLKVVQFWLTGAEAQDETIMTGIRAYSDENTNTLKKADQYKKVVYISGHNSLLDASGELLRVNEQSSFAATAP